MTKHDCPGILRAIQFGRVSAMVGKPAAEELMRRVDIHLAPARLRAMEQKVGHGFLEAAEEELNVSVTAATREQTNLEKMNSHRHIPKPKA